MKLRLMGFVVIAILASTLTTFAQVAKMEGTITGKGADGKVEPIEGATVDIFRMDIKGIYTVKTDKKGNYIHTGIPYSGKYWVIASAPGWHANGAFDVQPERPPRNDIQLVPGDGHRPTYDEIIALSKNPTAGGGNTAPADPKAEAERKKKEDEARKSNENFESMKKTFEEGLEFAKKGGDFYGKHDYPNAIEQYKQAVDKYRAASELDATQQVIFGNMSLAYKNMAVSKFNTNNKDGAQQDFKDSVTAAKQALALLDKKPDDKDYLTNSTNMLEILVDTNFVLGDRFQDTTALNDALAEYNILVTKYGNDNKKISNAYAKMGDVLNALANNMSLEEGTAKRTEAKADYEKALSLNDKNAKAYIGMVMLIANDPNADVEKYKQGVDYAKKAKAVADPNSNEAHQADEFIKNLEDTITAMNDSKNANSGGKKKKP